MSSIQAFRKRAIELFLQHADHSGYTLADYYIDSFLRSVLKLPALPQGQLPYEGWIVGNQQENKLLSISAKGIALIKRWEGLRLSAYQCSADVWTIGWGHTQGVRPGMRITRRQAEKYFLADIKVFEAAVHRHVQVELNQNQFDALVSFCYNVGASQFANSTLVRLLNQGQYDQAAQQFSRWVRAGGKTVQGLVNRRRQEYALFVL